MPLYEHKSVRPTLGPDVWVAPNATIIGDVTVGEKSSIWFGAVLRGDVFPIRIGARTNIQDNAVVHVTASKASTTIGDDVTIGHLAIVHGCNVGSRCLIGMGSILLDGAVIEEESFIAAGSLVVPGMRVPSRSLVMGRPGKIVRTLDEQALAQIRASAEAYIAYAKDFRESMRVVG